MIKPTMKQSSTILLVVVLFIITMTLNVSANQFIQGSISIHPSLQQYGINVDFSGVEIELVSKEGYVKDSVKSPPTGHFIVPVYETGSFVLRVKAPQQYNFEPKETPVDLVPGGNQQVDVNFVLMGFTVNGKIESEYIDSESNSVGVAGVTVTISNEQVSQQAVTDETGCYSFGKIVPGKYTIKASHSTFTFSKNSIAVEVLPQGETKVSDSLVISGYDLKGKVMVMSGSSKVELPMSDVTVYLSISENCNIANKQKICPQQQVTNVPQSLTIAGVVLCSTTSNADGEFSFNGIPAAKNKNQCELTVTPYYQGFNIEPANAKLSVSGPTQLKTIFRVKGFSISGKVTDEQNNPLQNVLVKIKHYSAEGEEVVSTKQTDVRGVYVLEDQIGHGLYSVNVEKSDAGRKLWFNELSKVSVDLQTRTFPEITVSHVEICGSFKLSNSNFDANQKRRVYLESKEYSTTAETSNGKFCFKVPVTLRNTKLTVRVDLSDKEKAKGLRFSAWSKDITDIASIGDIILAQELLSLTGRIKCLDKTCDTSVVVSISRKGGADAFTASTSIDESGAFTFNNLLPGVYVIQGRKESWCWEKDSTEHTLSSGATSLKEELKQGGFKLSVLNNNSFKVALKILQNKAQIKQVDLTVGRNDICLPTVGTYELQPEGCVKFQQESFEYNTNRRDQLITLQPQAYLMKGQVSVSDKFESADDITVHVGKQKLEGQKSDSSTFEFAYWAPVSESGQSVTFKPSSKVYLFSPSSVTQKLPKLQALTSCLPAISTVKAVRGQFITGKVFNEKQEGIEGVTVSVTDGENTIVEVLSKADGSYEAGPLDSSIAYQKQAKKVGYSFMEKEGTNNFQAVQLSSITVSIVSPDSKEELAGVFLSLSSQRFRNNTVTNGQGRTTFSHLYPGNYYLIPMLKEYTFEPSTIQIDLGEGEDKKISINAKRVAFSCYGVVQSLNREPEASVVVQAYGPDSQYEETVSDSEGRYRIRGLKPNVAYKISVKIGNQFKEDQSTIADDNSIAFIERASPKETTVVVNNGDYAEEVNFIVFRTQPLVLLAGHVNVTTSSADIASKLDDIIRTAQVELLVGPNLNRAKVQQTQPLSITRYFQFVVPLDFSQSNLQFFVRVVPADSFDRKMYKADLRMQYVTSMKSIISSAQNKGVASTGVQTGTMTRLGTYSTSIPLTIEYINSR